MADEVGAAFVSLVPSFQNGPKIIGAELEKAFAGSDKVAARAGATAGKRFGAAFGRDKGAATAAEAAQKKVAAAAAAAAKQVEKAREAEADATRKAAIEEKKLEELRASGKAKASQLLAVEDRLVKSQRALKDAQGKTAAAIKGQEQQQESARKEMAETAKETTRASRAFDVLSKNLKGLSVPKGAFKGLAGGASTAGRDAGTDFGKGFGRSAKAGVDKTKGAVTGSMRSIVGAAAALFAGVQVGSFFSSANAEAREAQKVSAVTAQIIKSTGSAAKLTAGQVSDLATAISNKTGVDDEQIQAGANLLLTFKNVKREGAGLDDIFGRATASAADLSAAGFGSVDGAAKMLGKALNDPIKGVSALGRAGVTFTAEQKEQIKTLTESGDVLGAQKLIMKEVESQVGGVAAASSTAGEKMHVAFGNLKEQVGTALLPALDGIATIFTTRVFPAASSFVTFAEKRLTPVLSSIGGAVGAAFTILTKGDFNKKIGEALGAEEDSPIVDVLFTIREVALELGPIVKGMVSNWVGLFKQLAPAVGPFVTQLFAAAKQLFPVFQQLQGTVFKAIGDIVSKLLPVIGGLISSLLPALVQIGSAVGSVLNAVIPIVTQIVTTLLGAIQKNMPAIQTAFSTLGSIISGIGTLITTVWAAVGPVVLPIVETIFGTIVNVIGGAFQIIDGLIKVITGVLTGDFSKAGEGLKQIVGGVFQIVTSIITGARDIIGGVVGAIVGFFTTVIGRAFNFFKNAVTTVFNAVVGAVRSFWDQRVKPVVDRLVNFFRVTIPAAFGLMRAKALAIFAAVVGVVRGFWFDKVKPIVDRVVSFFSKSIPNAFLALKNKAVEIFRKVRDFIRGAFDKDKGIPSIFTRAVEQIGKIWQGLQDLAKIPIRFIVETVINGGLIKAFNDLVGLIPFADSKWKLPNMALPQGFAQGGILPGTSTWRQGDDQLVPMRRGEGVTITEALDSYETRRLLALNRHVLSGGTPDSFRKKYGEGYAKGGVVWPATSRQLSGSYKGHSGVDIPRPAGDPIFAIMNGAIDYTGWNRGYGQAVFERLANGLMAVYGHTSRVLVRAGQAVQAGQKIAEVGSTGHSTGNHLHIEVNGAGGFGSAANRQFTLDFLNGSSNASGSSDGGTESGFNPLGFVLDMARDKLKDAVSGLLKDVPNSGIGALVHGIPNGLIDYLYTSVKGMVGQSSSDGNFGDGTSGVDGATSAITRAAAAAIGPRFGITSIGTYPGHDPSETKALDFMTSDLKKHNAIAQYVWGNARELGVNYMISWNRIWNIQRDAVGAWRRYTRYGGGGDASQQHKNHVHLSFFAKGTKKAPAGPAVVGENGPELVWFNGGEQVTPARQTQDLMKAKEITAHSFVMDTSDVPATTGDGGWYEMRVTNWDTGKAMVRRVSRSESRQDAAFDRGLSRMGGR